MYTVPIILSLRKLSNNDNWKVKKVDKISKRYREKYIH